MKKLWAYAAYISISSLAQGLATARFIGRLFPSLEQYPILVFAILGLSILAWWTFGMLLWFWIKE